ncbi:hypothetical protein VCB98_00420 [Gammaproteobacteria bacterium AB-CW1]|uniref:CheW-like domain-containing protein n=1 Tax=Natronospira elongata TaxID=3110268 RepID=A0AAP6MLQ0_9GAMM|nr:hypothetical protein [Gammaproteobacteria bacterium AB-CW1]
MSQGEQPLARYLEDMLTEPEADSPAESVVQPPAAVEPEPEPVPQPEPTSGSEEAVTEEWWGFGVAHLILVVSGKEVAAVLEACPPGLELADGVMDQGEYRLYGSSRRLVDPAALILPPEQLDRLPPLEQRAQGLIHLKREGLSLIAGSEPMPVALSGDEIRWRETSGSRAWMAGTVMSRGMVVLDVAGIMAVLSGEGD